MSNDQTPAADRGSECNDQLGRAPFEEIEERRRVIDKKRIADEAQHFFEWPDPKDKNYVTLTSCVIFAATIAEMVRSEERERWTEAVMAELDGNGQAHAIVTHATDA